MASLLLLLVPLDSTFFIYVTLFAVLVFSGIGLPIPEEITLLFGGYLAYLEFTHFWTTIYILTAGILLADIVGYCIGRYAFTWITEKFAHVGFITSTLKKAEYYFERHGKKVVLFSRAFVGIRVAVPILAGHFKMRFGKFLLFDAIAAIPWTLFLVTLSYYLGTGLDLITDVKEIKHIVFALIGLAILIGAGLKFIRK